MRAVVQRVSGAQVRDQDAGVVLGRIGPGLVVLLGIGRGDGERDATWIVDKVVGLRIFSDDLRGGNGNRSVREVGGALLVVSQFTLYGDCRKGRRPSFSAAMPAAEAEPLYERTLALFRDTGLPTEAGRFGARMAVDLCNDGPVTLLLDSRT